MASTAETQVASDQPTDERRLGLPEDAYLDAAEAKWSIWIKDFFSSFRQPWWKIILWMLLFCVLLLATILLTLFVSNLLTQTLTWAGFEKWATSPFATATGAVAAASIAGTAVVLTLNQNKRVEASKTWWETFEWAAERAIPSKKENKALPYGVSLAILNPLLDDDLGGRRITRSERKSWELRKKACESLIGLLTEPYEEDKPGLETSEFQADEQAASPEGNVPNSGDPAEGQTPEHAATPTGKDFENAVGEVRTSPKRRPVLTDSDLRSVISYIDAHPRSEQARRLRDTHFEPLLIRNFESFLRKDERLRSDDRVQVLTSRFDIKSHLESLDPLAPRYFSRVPDALLVRGDKTLIVEIKSLQRETDSLRLQTLRKEKAQAQRVWDRGHIPTLLIVDYPIDPHHPDARGENFQAVFWPGSRAGWHRVSQAVLQLIGRATRTSTP